MKKRPTIRDVAQKASLSISTVSLVINDKKHVSDQTRTSVRQAIDELGYHPQRSARGLASRNSGNIGFLLSDDHFSQAEPFYTRIFLGTEFAARDLHYYILLTTVGRYFDPKRSVPRFLLERNVDGIIIAGQLNEKLIDYICGMDIPVILVDFELKRKSLSSVLIDNRGGIAAVANHLCSLGHRDIGFIGGDVSHPSIADRYAGYREAMAENSLTALESSISTDEPDTGLANGFEAARKVLTGSGSRPSAIIAANDAMAMGCAQFARSIGLKIPEHLSLVGFDDIEMSSHTDPPLTTVRVLKEEMGKIAVQHLVDMIRSPNPSVVTTRVPVELIIRGSTRSLMTDTVINKAGVSNFV
jgi:LacI family transcriptional regulator